MKEDIPFQVESLISNLLNQRENVYIRNNYRNRLESIRLAADKAIRKFDNELYLANTQGKRKVKA